MSETSERVKRFVRETSEIRKEIISGLEDREAKAIVYALSCAWISEWLAREPGYEVVLEAIGEASGSIIAASYRPELDKLLDEITGEQNA